MINFENRVFGCVIVKAINSNYNADFTHQPRTLPDGTVYATDKALKYSIRHYLNNQFKNENIYYYKRLNEKLNPLTLNETYKHIFGDFPTIKIIKGKKEVDTIDKKGILKNLLTCLDIKLFGATYAGEANISIHGPVQINHGINRFSSNEIYSEQIMSPFRNPGDEGDSEKEMTTLGQQSKLLEGHYVHHFSINPQNLEAMKKLSDNSSGLMIEDISKLKEAMRRGVSYYDSSSKAGTDNEFLLWIQLKKYSSLVLPVFTEFINVTRENDSVIIDCGNLKEILSKISDELDQIEVYYLPENTQVRNLPDNIILYDITTGKEL